jgi:hypothetical protein
MPSEAAPISQPPESPGVPQRGSKIWKSASDRSVVTIGRPISPTSHRSTPESLSKPLRPPRPATFRKRIIRHSRTAGKPGAGMVSTGSRKLSPVATPGASFRLPKPGIRAILPYPQKSKCRRIFIPSLHSAAKCLYCRHRRLLVCLSTRRGAPSDFLSTSIKPDEYLTGEPND